MQKADHQNDKKPVVEQHSAPGFFIRIAVGCYDALLLLAVLFLATALVLPFNSGHAFSSDQFLYPLYLLTVSFLFYGWFWTHGGQTLGLRTWKIKLCRFDGGPVSWGQAGLRFVFAILSWGCFGLGHLWCLFDKNRLCWHDYLSQTRLTPVDLEIHSLRD